MRRDAWAKLALSAMAISTGGGLAGLGLANYVASGSFDFYRQASTHAWRAEPLPPPVATSDLAFASEYRSSGGGAEPGRSIATFMD